MIDWKPFNAKAAERMRKAFPGYPYSIHGDCVWQLILAHFGSLIWPTPSAEVLGRAGGPDLYIRNSGGSCGGTRRCCGFPRTVERVGSLDLAFHAFHGPAVPQL